jgi:type II secretory pathway component GspD/PulD (secretin)
LVIHQTAAVHDEIANLLAALARLMDVQVAIEIRLLSVSEACFERLGIHLEPAGTTKECENTVATTRPGSEIIETSEGTMRIPTQVGKAFLTDSQVRELLETAQGDRRSNMLSEPQLTVLNGQQGTVNISDTKYFVTSLNLDCKEGKIICKPNQEAFEFGTFMTVLPTVSADRKSVLVSLKFKQTELAAPVPLIPVQFPIKQLDKDGKEKSKPELFTLFLQQPQVSTLAIDNTTVIPEGQTLLLGGVKKLTEERNEFGPPVLSKIPYLNRLFKNVGYGRETVSLLIMVTPRIVVREEEEQFEGGDQSIAQP